MKTLILFFSMMFFLSAAWGNPKSFEVPSEAITSWSEFDEFMVRAENEHEKLGWSYLISGGLVTLGGLIGANSSDDSAMQLVLGLSTTSGLAGISYGLIRLNSGTSYSSLYETLKKSEMTDLQRSAFLREYLRIERDKNAYRNRVRMISHLVASGLNLYSASSVDDSSTKTVLHVFAALNLAFAFSYSF